MPTVNETIRDHVVVQDLTLRRVIAGTDKRVQARLTQLSDDLRAAMAKYDPFGATGPTRREQRRRRLNAAAEQLIREAMADCYDILRGDLGRVTQAQSELVADAIERTLEDAVNG